MRKISKSEIVHTLIKKQKDNFLEGKKRMLCAEFSAPININTKSLSFNLHPEDIFQNTNMSPYGILKLAEVFKEKEREEDLARSIIDTIDKNFTGNVELINNFVSILEILDFPRFWKKAIEDKVLLKLFLKKMYFMREKDQTKIIEEFNLKLDEIKPFLEIIKENTSMKYPSNKSFKEIYEYLTKQPNKKIDDHEVWPGLVDNNNCPKCRKTMHTVKIKKYDKMEYNYCLSDEIIVFNTDQYLQFYEGLNPYKDEDRVEFWEEQIAECIPQRR